MKLVFLGTSAAIPTDKRGLPAVALVFDGEVILFDAGEGTQRQLRLAGLKLTRVRRILISHLHADHVFGLPGLIVSRSFVGGTGPLDIYGPPGLREFVEFNLRATEAHLQYELSVHEVAEGEFFSGPDYRLVAAFLKHRSTCLGYAFVENDRTGHFDAERARRLGIEPGPVYARLKAGGEVTLPDGRVVRGSDLVGPPIPGRKVAYVTDTIPCPGAYRLAQEADVLIFESTYAASDEKEAKESWHATSLQAAKIAKRSGAKKLVLTHFSSRYSDPGAFLERTAEVFPNVAVAEDFLVVEVQRKDSGKRDQP